MPSPATAAYGGATVGRLRSAISFVLIFYFYPADMIPIVSHRPLRLNGLVKPPPEDGRSAAGLAREGGRIKGVGGWVGGRLYLSLSPNHWRFFPPPSCLYVLRGLIFIADASAVAPTSAAPYLNEIFFFTFASSRYLTLK